MSHTCAMCGDEMVEPYGGYTLPPECIQLMQGADTADTDEAGRKVIVDLCSECTEIASRMVTDYDTSPLPECDVDAVRWQGSHRVQALIAGENDGNDDISERMLMDALATVRADVNGAVDPMLNSRIIEAYVIVLSFEQRGHIERGVTID